MEPVFKISGCKRQRLRNCLILATFANLVVVFVFLSNFIQEERFQSSHIAPISLKYIEGRRVGRRVTSHTNLGAPVAPDKAPLKEETAAGKMQASQRNLSQPNHNGLHENICFVHVGKTAGSFLACKLGVGIMHHIGCPGKKMKPSPHSMLANRTNGFLHKFTGMGSCLNGNATYLISLRNPIDRIASWFYFERPASQNVSLINPIHKQKRFLWMECPYWELEDMLRDGLRPIENGTVPQNVYLRHMTCQQLAWVAVMGKRPFHTHNHCNYEYYMNWTKSLAAPSEPRIVAVRQEHLEEDWNGLEHILGGGQLNDATLQLRLNESPVNQTDHKTIPMSARLSPLARQQACHALCAEIQVYREILELAENLSEKDRQTSLDELQATCPDLDLKATKICHDNFPQMEKECIKPGDQSCNWWYKRKPKKKQNQQSSYEPTTTKSG